MIILKTSGWSDYELIDSGNGQRLERFGKYVLVRPDPQIIWSPRKGKSIWDKCDAVFTTNWSFKTKLPEHWTVKYKDLTLLVRPTPFKHTGVFPEQSLQWDWITEKIKSSGREVNILNLFGYTGAATVALAKVGARVTHVDASKSSIAWMKENLIASGLDEKAVRYILDDCLKFVEREIKRGVKYDGIIMDPPIYGHGPSGEKWDFNESFPKLLRSCKELLSDNPLFILINAYAISSSSLMLENMLKEIVSGGEIEVGELALQEKDSDRLLSTGIFGRWSK